MNKIDFLNDIEVKVKDEAEELIKKAIITAKEDNTPAGFTTFTLDSVKNLFAGDEVYLFDGTAASMFYTIASVDTALKKIVITGAVAIAIGGKLVKTDAIVHLNDALSVYSKFRPISKQFEIEGDDGSVYDLPTGWDPYTNQIVSIEHPTGLDPAEYLDKCNYKVTLNESNAWVIDFNFPIPTGNTAVLIYKAPHSFGGDNPYTVTAPDSDFNAISNIAASKYLLALAALHGQSMSNTIPADVVNYDNKTPTYIIVATAYLGQAAAMLGLKIEELDGRFVDKSKTNVFKFKR